MIQRIQTLFLLGITAFSALMIFLPFQEVISAGQTYLLKLSPATFTKDHKGFIHVPMFLNVVIMILSIVTVFMFRNRKRQMKLSMILMLLSAILIGNLFVFHFIQGDPAAQTVNYKPASFFPVVNCILAFLARMFIKKDDELVRSADRIR
jgi:hypothetical protein